MKSSAQNVLHYTTSLFYFYRVLDEVEVLSFYHLIIQYHPTTQTVQSTLGSAIQGEGAYCAIYQNP